VWGRSGKCFGTSPPREFLHFRSAGEGKSGVVVFTDLGTGRSVFAGRREFAGVEGCIGLCRGGHQKAMSDARDGNGYYEVHCIANYPMMQGLS
jgi:hypothetical protein